MNDRELLELAAKAADVIWVDQTFSYDEFGRMMVDFGKGTTEWNPLTDDGDALRLAVKLNLVYMPYPNDFAVRVTRLDSPEFIEHYGNTNDPYAATRRAIVRAAAEIAKNI